MKLKPKKNTAKSRGEGCGTYFESEGRKTGPFTDVESSSNRASGKTGSSVLRARFGGWKRWPIVVIEEGERMVALEWDGSKEAGPIERRAGNRPLGIRDADSVGDVRHR